MPARLSRCLRALALVVLLALAGCSVPPGFAGQLPSGEQATPTTATAAVAPTVTAAEQPTAAAAAPASPAAAQPTPLAATDPTYKAIQALIQKANDEQVQAFASGDPR